MSFVDYRRIKRVGVPSIDENELKNDEGHEKTYGELNEKELKAAAEENHEEPLGTFVGRGRTEAEDEDEEAYVGGTANPFAASPSFSTLPRRPAEVRQSGRPKHQDVGQGFTGDLEAGDGYYARERPASAFGSLQPIAPRTRYSPSNASFLNEHVVPVYPTRTFVRDCFLTGFQIGSFLGTLLAFNLLVVIAIGAHIAKKISPFHHPPPRAKVDKEWETRISGERFSSRAEYYANFFGYECEDIDVETEDGFVLRMHHLASKKHRNLGHPVILQHGILSNSVTFMVNEERSLAFWLLEQGYDVYLSNIRTNFEMPHRQFKRSDPRYWAWAVKEIGTLDLPAIVDYVYQRTGRRPAYIGHSQGTGSMFLGLSRGMRPEMGEKLSCFIALAPAVYAGPVLRSFPFSLMRKFKARWAWSLVFGVREFIPIISILQAVMPSWLFGHIAFPVFAFIFGFHDHNWVARQVPKFFRTVAVANPSELLYYYMSCLSYHNCIFKTEVLEPWFPASFPPLAIFYGTLDTLVLGKPLVERIRSNEPNVRLVKVVALENYEHLDPIWGVNAVTDLFFSVRDVIEETKNGTQPRRQVRSTFSE